MELADLINTHQVTALSDYDALLEVGRVDVTLVPRDREYERNPPEGSIRIELKLADTSYWKPAWQGIARDLGLDRRTTSRGKGRADLAVVFMTHCCGEYAHPVRPTTGGDREKLWASIPTKPNQLIPWPDTAGFRLITCGNEEIVDWPTAVPGRWARFQARCRLLYLRRAADE